MPVLTLSFPSRFPDGMAARPKRGNGHVRHVHYIMIEYCMQTRWGPGIMF